MLRTEAISIRSEQGGVYLEGGNSVYLQGAQVETAKDLTIKGNPNELQSPLEIMDASLAQIRQDDGKNENYKTDGRLFCFPLWEADSPKVGNVNPEQLPISQSLKNMPLNWAEEYDKTLDMDDPRNFGFKSHNEELEFKKAGIRLADLLHNELGSEYDVKVQLN